MRSVVWSKHAHNDFRGIIGYIAQDNPSAAHKVATRIDETIQALAATPTGRRGRVSGGHGSRLHLSGKLDGDQLKGTWADGEHRGEWTATRLE